MQDQGRPVPEPVIVDYSAYTQLQARVSFRGLSVKCVLAGKERYHIDGREYSVAAGQYLLGNAACEGSVLIDSPTPVYGLCIDVPVPLLAEIAAVQHAPDGVCPQELLSFMQSPVFPEELYETRATTSGALLRELAGRIAHTPGRHCVPREWLYTFAERLLAEQHTVYRQYNAVRAVKPSTRAELLRRVRAGRRFMDAMYTQNIDIATVAREAALSEYHFFRLFRSVYGTTPHRYIRHRRIDTACQLLRAGRSVSDVALAVGFADLQSFSKAFRKCLGYPPSSLLPAQHTARK